jgi:hypothetical protein
MSAPGIFLIGTLFLLAAGNVAWAQTPSPAVLTIDDAVATAMRDNRRVQSSALDVSLKWTLVFHPHTPSEIDSLRPVITAAHGRVIDSK